MVAPSMVLASKVCWPEGTSKAGLADGAFSNFTSELLMAFTAIGPVTVT